MSGTTPPKDSPVKDSSNSSSNNSSNSTSSNSNAAPVAAAAPQPAKTSNFSISSILSRPDNESKKKEVAEDVKAKLSCPADSAHEALKIDTHLAAAAQLGHFHPGLSQAFLDRQLPGKPTPWYPWFSAGPYLHFPFVSKYPSATIQIVFQ